MPLRGESVGTAYVRILADGSGLPQSIKDQFDEAEEGVHAAGADHDKAYEKGFDDEAKKNKTLEKSLTKKVQNAFGKMDADAELLGRGFEEKISRAISSGIAQGDDDASLRNAYEIGDRIAAKIAAGINSGQGAASFKKGGLQRLIAGALADIQREEAAFEREWRAGFDKINADTEKASKGIVTGLRDMDSGLTRTRTALLNLHGHFDKELKKPIEDGGRTLNNFRTRLNQVDDGIDKFADRVGTSFGRGARNDFVNLIGAGARGLVLLGNIVPKVTKGFLSMKDGLSGVGAAFHSGEDGALSLGSGFAKLAGTMGTTVAGAAVLAAGLVLLEVLMGAMVSIVSGLVAALVALAGSLAFAAAGAVGALVGAILPLVAGIGVLILGIKNLVSNHMPALKAATAPVVKAFKELGSTAGDVFVKALPKLKALGPVLSGLKPLVRGVSQGLVSGFTSFIDVLKGPAFKEFTNTMTKFLPGAVASLGHIFANTFSGLLGFFRSLVPITSSFLNWLQRITHEFSVFTNSKDGQKSLLDFFDRAAASAQSVGHFLGSIGGLLSALFSQGKKTGDNIFDDMTNGIHNLTDYLNTHKGAVSRWFANGKQVADDVGQAIKNVGGFFRKLDTPENRQLAHQLFTLLGAAISYVTFTLGAASRAVQILVAAFAPLGKTIGQIAHIISVGFRGALVIVIGFIATLERSFGNMLKALGHVPGFGWAKKAANALLGAADSADKLAKKIKDVPTSHKSNVKVTANNITVPGVTGQLGTLINRINGVPNGHSNTKVNANGGSITGVVRQFQNLSSVINGLHSKTINVTVQRINKGSGPNVVARGGMFGTDGMERLAAGGIKRSYTYTNLLGEQGAEAVVPLSRPLGQVDPSVRLLSAFAQGKLNVGNGKQVNVGGITLVTPTADPHAAATEVINRLVPYI